MPALLEAYDIPYVFSDPLTLALCLDKAMAKRVLRDAGVPTAPFALIEAEADHRSAGVGFPAFPQAGIGRLGQGRGRSARG